MSALLSGMMKLVGFPKFSSSLPGPHGVSFVRDRISSPETSIHATTFYPTIGDGGGGSSQDTYWIRDAADGLAKYMSMSPSLFSHLAKSRHPDAPAEQALESAGDRGWPVVVFSHGLAGCADMYTNLCRSVASYGYIVIALEHEDGSGVHARTAGGSLVHYRKPPKGQPDD